MYTRSQLRAIENSHAIQQINADVLALDPFDSERQYQRPPIAPVWLAMPHAEPSHPDLTALPEGWRPRGRSDYERRKHSGRPAPKPLPARAADLIAADLKAMGREIAERQLAMLGLPSST
jgi:hypothetical protein